ncbi:hypothetical protein HYZ41_00385 [archaeon]|nr:hypothetical protein [archaeon]
MALKYSELLGVGTLVNLRHRFGENYVRAVVKNFDKEDETYGFIWWKDPNKKAIKHAEIFVDHINIEKLDGSLNVTYKNAFNGIHTEYREDHEKKNIFEKWESMLNKALL